MKAKRRRNRKISDSSSELDANDGSDFVESQDTKEGSATPDSDASSAEEFSITSRKKAGASAKRAALRTKPANKRTRPSRNRNVDKTGQASPSMADVSFSVNLFY